MDFNILKNSKRCNNINWIKHTDHTISSLKKYLLIFDLIKDIKHLNAIIRLLENDYSNIDIPERIHLISELKNDSASKKSFLLRYGEHEGERLFDIRSNRAKITNSKQYLIEKFGKKKAASILKSKCPNNVETLKYKFPDTWQEKLKEYNKNYSFSNSKEGYILKYGEKIGSKKWSDRVKNRKISNSKKGYILKYGEKIGSKKWSDKQKKHSYRISKQYYIDTYGNELGKKLCAENSLYGLLKKQNGEEWFKKFLTDKGNRSKGPTKEKMILKHGKILGEKKYKEYVKKQKYAHTLPYFLELYGEKEGIKKYDNHRKHIIENLINSKNKSLISEELFNRLNEKIKNMDLVYYYSHNKEKFIMDDETNKICFYDFTYKNKIIEFHGDFWHMNPKTYTGNQRNKKSQLLASDIWDHDEYKKNLAVKHGNDILIIWESEYRTNKLDIIEKCLTFLNN